MADFRISTPYQQQADGSLKAHQSFYPSLESAVAAMDEHHAADGACIYERREERVSAERIEQARARLKAAAGKR